MNTVLAVREHAPAEIVELDASITALEGRLAASYSRKHLLERLLAVISEAGPAATGAHGTHAAYAPPATQPMAIVR